MSKFEKLSPELADLFLRIDAAEPTDPVLRAAADLWRERRGSALLQGLSLINDLPAFVRPHAFLARMALDGGKKWTFSDAGASARASLGQQAGCVMDAAEPALAHRLEVLFGLVAEKDEPCAAMFELQAPGDRRHLCEVYAAPVAARDGTETELIAVLNWRKEAMR
jgi:hypothetical protein